MIWWDRELIKKTNKLKLDVFMDTRYVDDINTALPPVQPGTRYVNDTIKVLAEKVEEDEEREKDEITMKLLQAIGNSIHFSIQVEIDYPSRYDDKKMPTLDLKLWVNQENNMCKILHEHYMKPMSSIAVLDSRSAMAWSTKRTVLTQDALRIILNCSRELQWEIVAAHLSYYSARMQYSGYGHQFRLEVIQSALKAYENLREDERQGKRPLYRHKTWNTREREKERTAKKLLVQERR